MGDEDGVVALHIGEYEQLLYGSMVANVTFLVRVGLSPLTGCTSEKCHIEEVCFIGIDVVLLLGGELGEHKVLFDGIGMDAIVEFGDFAIEVPRERQAGIFIKLEPAIVLHHIEFELC